MDTTDSPPPEEDPALPALRRLVAIAQSDTGQSRRVANFLLAWWNAHACGGFDPTELWAVEDPIRADIIAVIGLIARHREAATAYGMGDAFEALVRRWRPGVNQSER